MRSPMREATGGNEQESVIQIIVPIYNEGENVKILYQRLRDDNVAFDQLTFVYDLDSDTSLPYIEAMKRQDARVIPLKNTLGRGVVNALRFSFSQVSAGPVIVVMGDNSDKLSLIPEMIECWKSGATLVSASRYMSGGKQHGGGVVKSTLSRIAGKSLALLGLPTADPTNNFKLYDGTWLRSQQLESRGGFEIALELTYKAFREARKIIELPTVWEDRTIGKSNFKLFRWLPHYLRWYFRTIWALLARVVL